MNDSVCFESTHSKVNSKIKTNNERLLPSLDSSQTQRMLT